MLTEQSTQDSVSAADSGSVSQVTDASLEQGVDSGISDVSQSGCSCPSSTLPSWCSPSPFPTSPLKPAPSVVSPVVEAHLAALLRHFSPGQLDRLIGRKMGLERVDVVAELQRRGIGGATAAIFRFLSPEQLCR